MIEIKFQAENVNQLKLKILEFSDLLFTQNNSNVNLELPLNLSGNLIEKGVTNGGQEKNLPQEESKREVVPETKVVSTPSVPEAKVEKAEVVKKKAPQLKAAKEAPLLATNATPPQETSPEKVFTQDEVKTFVNKVNIEYGQTVARNVLLKFGASRFSELKPEFFNDCVKECELKLAGN